jgi:hypothetical protein
MVFSCCVNYKGKIKMRTYKVYLTANPDSSLICRTPQSLAVAKEFYKGKGDITIEEILSVTLNDPMEQ